MQSSKVLKIDAAVNFILGILLLLLIPFPEQVSQFLGLPKIRQIFYPSIMGGVFIGIGIALLIESYREESQQLVGLGLGGAIAINLCGVLMGWIIFGNLELPIRGFIFLWIIAIILMVVSGMELMIHKMMKQLG